jgi:hypothetical protein
MLGNQGGIRGRGWPAGRGSGTARAANQVQRLDLMALASGWAADFRALNFQAFENQALSAMRLVFADP